MNKSQLFIISPIVILVGLYTSLIVFKPQPIELQAATWLGDQAKTLPAFQLTDHDGQSFTEQSLNGQWDLLFFGYTHCPDICPDTLQVLANVTKQIEDPAVRQQLRVTFVTIDPERDDLARMKSYVEYFNPAFHSARGDMEQLRKLTGALGIYHTIEKSEDGSRYEVAHSGVLTLIDPQGRFSALFSTPHDGTRIAHDLNELIRS